MTAGESKRFWAKVDMAGGPYACWTWTAYLDHDGYGNVGVKRKIRRAHRVMMEVGGVSTEGLSVHHRCENRACVNPAHLELIEHRAHMQGHRATLLANLQARLPAERTCDECGSAFTPTQPRQRFCATRCQVRVKNRKYLARKAAA